MVRDSQEVQSRPLNFCWEHTSHLGSIEQRLEQLMLWVVEAHEAGLPFTLELGGRTVSSYRAACRRLAEYSP